MDNSQIYNSSKKWGQAMELVSDGDTHTVYGFLIPERTSGPLAEDIYSTGFGIENRELYKVIIPVHENNPMISTGDTIRFDSCSYIVLNTNIRYFKNNPLYIKALIEKRKEAGI